MRLDVENNRTPLNEFIESLGSQCEPVELVRHGEVVATVATHERSDLAKAKLSARGLELVKKARASAKKAQPLNERQLKADINVTLDEVRKQHASRSR